jgi:hypothetical protein
VWSNFAKLFAHVPSSVGQYPTVESAKNVLKNSFGLLELEMADLERFFEKNTLSPLGVKKIFNYYVLIF